MPSELQVSELYQRDTETGRGVTEIRFPEVTEPGVAVLCEVVPAAAAEHAQQTGCRTCRIFSISSVLTVIIPAPLTYIAVHIVQSEGIFISQTADVYGLLTIYSSAACAAGIIPIEIHFLCVGIIAIRKISRRSCAAGVLPLGFGRQIEFVTGGKFSGTDFIEFVTKSLCFAPAHLFHRTAASAARMTAAVTSLKKPDFSETPA